MKYKNRKELKENFIPNYLCNGVGNRTDNPIWRLIHKSTIFHIICGFKFPFEHEWVPWSGSVQPFK